MYRQHLNCPSVAGGSSRKKHHFQKSTVEVILIEESCKFANRIKIRVSTLFLPVVIATRSLPPFPS